MSSSQLAKSLVTGRVTCAVTLGKGGNTPGIGHVSFSYRVRLACTLKEASS